MTSRGRNRIQNSITTLNAIMKKRRREDSYRKWRSLKMSISNIQNRKDWKSKKGITHFMKMVKLF